MDRAALAHLWIFFAADLRGTVEFDTIRSELDFTRFLSGGFHETPLIAQIGKNFALPEDKQIPGARLIGMALDEFRAIKRRVGGKLIMIEREMDCVKLQNFYQANGFKSWTKRSDAKDGVCYDQMFAVI